MVAVASNQRGVILDAVRAMYTEVASHPEMEFHFPTGEAAVRFVGYPATVLDDVPRKALESFAGVGYPFAARAIRSGNTVLDIGSGSGTDAILAAQLAGPTGRVIGLDMTSAMRDKFLRNAADAGLANITVLEGNAEEIPLPDESVDVVTSNGVINLVPDKRLAFAEIWRVLKPGGRLQLSDIVVGSLPSEACRSQPNLWAECVVGATRLEDYESTMRAVGFSGIEVLQQFDYFAGSSSEETRKVAGSFGAKSVTLRAERP